MESMISLYCKTIIYPIEQKKKEIMKRILEGNEQEYLLYYYLNKYDELLIKKYCELEKLLNENDN